MYVFSCLVSMFRLRCCFKYHKSLLFFGRKRETARESNCHPCWNTKLLTLDFPSEDKARWCMLWLCEDKSGDDGTEDEDPLLSLFLTLLDFDGDDRLEELSEPALPLELDAFVMLLLPTGFGIVPWWLFVLWDDIDDIELRRELLEWVDEDDCGGDWWLLLWFWDDWSFPWWLLEESHRKRDWVAFKRKCYNNKDKNQVVFISKDSWNIK